MPTGAGKCLVYDQLALTKLQQQLLQQLLCQPLKLALWRPVQLSNSSQVCASCSLVMPRVSELLSTCTSLI